MLCKWSFLEAKYSVLLHVFVNFVSQGMLNLQIVLVFAPTGRRLECQRKNTLRLAKEGFFLSRQNPFAKERTEVLHLTAFSF